MYLTTIWFFVRRMPKVVAMLFNLVVIFLTIFLLVGCYNLSNDSTFLVRYRFDSGSPFYSVIKNSFNRTNSTTSLSGLQEVRIASGYMGVCVTHIPKTYDDDVTSVCYPRKDLANTSLYSDLSIEMFELPSAKQTELPIKLNILELAEVTSRHVVHPYVLMATVILAMLMFLMIMYVTVPYLPFKYYVLRATLGCNAVLVLLWGIGAMWTHVGIHACSELVPGASMGILEVQKGIKAATMSWLSFAFLLVQLGIVWFLYLKDRKNLNEEIDKITAKQSSFKRQADSFDNSTLNSKI